MNPYEPTRDKSTSGINAPPECHFALGDHTISVASEMVPWYLPLLGKILVSVDGKAPVSSSQLRWQENFDFTISDKGRDAPATLKSHGFSFGRQPFRIFVDGELVIESSVPVKRWWIGFMLGICIGIAIVVVACVTVASLVAFP